MTADSQVGSGTVPKSVSRRRTFFHGTNFDFAPGDVIDPKDRPAPQPLPESEKRIGPWTHRTAAGHLMSDEMVRAPPYLSVTPDRGLAQHYATHNEGGRVYQVRLTGELKADPYPVKGHFLTEHPVQVVRQLFNDRRKSTTGEPGLTEV